MGGGFVAAGGVQDASFAHLLDPKRKWYNNKRLAWTSIAHPVHLMTSVFNRIILLNAWIVLSCVTACVYLQ